MPSSELPTIYTCKERRANVVYIRVKTQHLDAAHSPPSVSFFPRGIAMGSRNELKAKREAVQDELKQDQEVWYRVERQARNEALWSRKG
jgi:hypothetical protein